MITLALVRHAKSDWGDPQLDDHDRPLNSRGLRDAPRMARRLADSGFHPDAILASTAVRAATTADFFSGPFRVPVELQERLYAAPATVLLRAASERAARSVIVVAHDPGISTLAAELSRGGIARMPTCAVAVFTWYESDWDVSTSLDPASWTFAAPR
jgi:phosphohistidine phosphatase